MNAVLPPRVPLRERLQEQTKHLPVPCRQHRLVLGVVLVLWLLDILVKALHGLLMMIVGSLGQRLDRGAWIVLEKLGPVWRVVVYVLAAKRQDRVHEPL